MSMEAKMDLQKTQAMIYDMENRRHAVEAKISEVLPRLNSTNNNTSDCCSENNKLLKFLELQIQKLNEENVRFNCELKHVKEAVEDICELLSEKGLLIKEEEDVA